MEQEEHELLEPDCAAQEEEGNSGAAGFEFNQLQYRR